MELIVGLEVHAELNTARKMFCSCDARWFGKKPNTHVCPVCLGMPGALPVPNREAIMWTARIALALNCTINKNSYFERKHYFYPDLPKGYQISQYKHPIGYQGYLDVLFDGKTERITIERVHLEEDTGKLSYKTDTHGERVGLVDFNRSGVPLVEIVTHPVIHDPELAAAYLKQLRMTILHLGVSDVDMEKGSMRCEPNISVRPSGQLNLPSYKVEVKNINSFRFVKKAIEYEYTRHQKILEEGETPTQETRRYVESVGSTEPMRQKEEARDYRYMPEPDIPPIRLTKKDVKREQDALDSTDTLDKKEKQFTNLGATPEEALYLSKNHDKGALVIATASLYNTPAIDKVLFTRTIITAVINQVSGSRITPQELYETTISRLTPIAYDQKLINQLVDNSIKKEPQAVQDYKAGNDGSINVIVGTAIRDAKGAASPSIIRDNVIKKLSES